MIKENEIRIGNLYQDRYGNYRTIEELSKSLFVDDIFDRGISVESMLPIPITGDVLLKCGFIQERFNKHVFVKEYNENGQLVLFSPDSAVAIDNKIKGFYYWFNRNAHEVLYIHQLQNLYFALIGTELDVKL